MDCEKFDQHVIDALYGELDELTAAEHVRHTESCTRCAQTFAGLKSARGAARLPLEEPSDDLEERILAAERMAVRRAPWYSKVVRGAAWAGSLAMRPQLAMAALFVMVVGSSLLLLRARPGTVGAPVQITQRGEPGPTSEPEVAKNTELRGADAPRIGGRDEGRRDEERAEPKRAADAAGPAPAQAAAAEGKAGAAPAEPPGGGGAPADATTLLAEARAQKEKSGCVSALPRFDAVSDKYPSSPEAALAKQEAAACERQMSEVASPPPAPRAPLPMMKSPAKAGPPAPAATPPPATDVK